MEDCYFFMTASCTKGSACPFRHCEAAKTNGICPQWLAPAGCHSPTCIHRHSTFEPKNRADIQCYWEAHGGCKKVSCPFLHTNSGKGLSLTQTAPPEDAPHTRDNTTKGGAPPNPNTGREFPPPSKAADKLAAPAKRPNRDAVSPERSIQPSSLGFEVKSFDEIMREKRQRQEQRHHHDVKEEEGSIKSTVFRDAAAAPAPSTTAIATSVVVAPARDAPAVATDREDSQVPARSSTVRSARPLAAANASSSSTTSAKTAPPPSSPLDEEDIDKQLAEIEELINS